jgi:hypothetical protein
MRAERAILVSLSGPAAQKRFNPRSLRKWHSQDDYCLATDLALRLNGDGGTATAYLGWLQIVAENMVAANWLQVGTVAQALLERRTLSETEISSLLANRPRQFPRMELLQ